MRMTSDRIARTQHGSMKPATLKWVRHPRVHEIFAAMGGELLDQKKSQRRKRDYLNVFCNCSLTP